MIASEQPPEESGPELRVPDTYRGWTIEQNYLDEWEGVGPNYDASYEGPEDGWVSNGEMCTGKTWDLLREEIDAYIEEHPNAVA